jgi:FkbH-like protein
MSSTPVRCLLISDFTIAVLRPLLEDSREPPDLTCVLAPYGQVLSLLIDETAPSWTPKSDVAVVWTRPHFIESFRRLIDNQTVSLDAILSEVDEFVGHLITAATRAATLFVPCWTLPTYERGLGILSMNPEAGASYALLRMNARLAEGLSASRNAYVLDAGRWMTVAGGNSTSPKLWHLGKIAFSPEVFKLAASDIKAGVRALRGQSKKLIALDLDDTLWGGVVGDVGWEHLKLGGHDAVGEAYVEFQHALKALTRRGVLLGIVSKNTESVALEAVDRHPEMVLRRDDFAGWRINWSDKAQNLVDLATEVSLGLDSVVFIDDNPAERARVREALPQVLVPDWPVDKLLYVKALKELTCFDTASISAEDRARTAMYVADRTRNATRNVAQSLEEYLCALDLHVVCEQLDSTNLARAVQLLNKTNQMNLATRRLLEQEFREWSERVGNEVFVFRVGDRFGEYGLTGLASLSTCDGTAEIVDFVVSCRVLGRGVEETMVYWLTERSRQLGLSRLVATFKPTPRNAPCREFFENRSRFEVVDGQFARRLEQSYALPRHVKFQYEADRRATVVI